MRKIFLSFLLALLSLSGAMYAYDFSAIVDGQKLCFNITDAGNLYCEVTEETSSGYSTPLTGELTIPATVDNPDDGQTYTIVGLGRWALEYNSSLTKVNLPTASTFTYIESQAFYQTGISSITIPDNVTTLGSSCFSGSYIEEIKPEDIGSGITTIPSGAFKDCDFLVRAVFPNTVLTFEESVFCDCDALKYVELGNAVTGVWSSTFGSDYYSYNKSAIDTIVLKCTTPPHVELYSHYGTDYDFYDELVNRCLLYVPASAVETYKAADHWKRFKYTYAEGTEVELHKVTFRHHNNPNLDAAYLLVNGMSMSDYSSIKGVTGETFTVKVGFGNKYFGLDSVTFDGVNITDRFVNNETTLQIPATDVVLDLTYTLVTMPYDFTEVIPSGQLLYFTITDDANHKVKIVNQTGGRSTGGNVSQAYLTGNDEPKGDLIIPTTVTHNDVTYTIEEVDTLAFYSCGDLTSVAFSEGLKALRSCAFEDCWYIQGTMSIPESCTTMEDQVFRGCSITDFYPGGARSLETYLLLYNPVTIIRASSATEEVHSYIVQEADLKEFEMGENVTFVSSYAFRSCTGLEKVTCYATTPPAVKTGIDAEYDASYWASFDATGRKLYVPKNSKTAYEANTCWAMFDIIEMGDTYTITTATTGGVGTVTGGGRYEINTSVELTATPALHYEFLQWSDGNTDNPRTITVTGNQTYTAEFGPLATQVGDRLSLMQDGKEVRYIVTSVSPREVKLVGNGNYYREFEGEWTIPGIVTDYWGEEFQLTRLAEYCLTNNSSITILHIPEGVRVVESYALYGSNFREWYFPSTIDSIGANESGCSYLRDIHFAGISHLRTIEMYDYSSNCPLWLNAESDAFCVKDGVALFYRGDLPAKAEVPEGVEVIARDVLRKTYTGSLRELRLPTTLRVLSTDAFAYVSDHLTVHVQSPTPPAVMPDNMPFAYENNNNVHLRIACSVDPMPYEEDAYWSSWGDMAQGSKYFLTLENNTPLYGTLTWTESTCGTVHLIATPAHAQYMLESWSTGQTDAEIDVVLTRDTVISASFGYAEFTVRYLDWDNTVLSTQQVLYGSDAVPPTNPTREGYTFRQWDDNGRNIVADRDIHAVYDINKYTIKFLDEDGLTELQVLEVEHGQTPVYTNPTPTKAADDSCTYAFDHWAPTIVPATEAATYTAVFSKTYKDYYVRFYNWNNDLLDEQSLHYGDAITYQGVAPTRPRTNTRVYTFSGWSDGFEDGVTTVSGNMEFLAEFDDAVRYYKVWFASCETCANIGSADVEYEGDATSQAPTAEEVNIYAPEGKEFDHWSSDITSITIDELVVWPIWRTKLIEITEVRVTFEAPAVGQSTYKGEGYIVPEDPNFNMIGRVSVPEGANYEVSGYFFDLTPWVAIDDETFQTGKQYSVEIDLLPKEGYTFPHDGFFVDANQVDILINGAAPANTGGNDVELSVYAYFTPSVSTAIEQANEEAKAVKIIRDNQLYIIRDGKTYNAMGVEVTR